MQPSPERQQSFPESQGAALHDALPPDEWNYTTRGLAAICKEGVDAIGKTLKELELAGYIIRRQLRGKDGRISDTEYTIFEKPRKPSPPGTASPDTENPYLDNPDAEEPDTDNPAQLNTKKSNTQKSNTDLSSTHSFFLPAADGNGRTGLRKKQRSESKSNTTFSVSSMTGCSLMSW